MEIAEILNIVFGGTSIVGLATTLIFWSKSKRAKEAETVTAESNAQQSKSEAEQADIATQMQNNGDIAGKNKPEIIEILKGQVERNHVPFIDIYHCGVTPANFNTFFLKTDNTHMYKGFDILARRVASGILANYY